MLHITIQQGNTYLDRFTISLHLHFFPYTLSLLELKNLKLIKFKLLRNNTLRHIWCTKESLEYILILWLNLIKNIKMLAIIINKLLWKMAILTNSSEIQNRPGKRNKKKKEKKKMPNFWSFLQWVRWDTGPHKYRNTRTTHIAIHNIRNIYRDIYKYDIKVDIFCAQSHLQLCPLWKWVCPVKRKNCCVMFGKNIVFFWGREKLSVADMSLFNGTSSTLSQLIKHGRPVELWEKCEFNGIVLRQTCAISTLHFALPHTHTHTHSLTHTRLLCKEGLRVELCACMFVC